MEKDIKIYNKNKHEQEEVTLKIKRFKLNGIPVCLSWSGSENKEREACMFLGLRRMGTQYVCMYGGEDIFHEMGDPIKPCKNCPLWKEN